MSGKAGALKKAQLAELLEPVLPRARRCAEAEGSRTARPPAADLVWSTSAPPEVFKRAHLPGAINIPQAEVNTRLEELLDLPAPPVLYCRAGADSKVLAGELASGGTPVAFLEGGVLGWEGDGFALERAN